MDSYTNQWIVKPRIGQKNQFIFIWLLFFSFHSRFWCHGVPKIYMGLPSIRTPFHMNIAESYVFLYDLYIFLFVIVIIVFIFRSQTVYNQLWFSFISHDIYPTSFFFHAGLNDGFCECLIFIVKLNLEMTDVQPIACQTNKQVQSNKKRRAVL